MRLMLAALIIITGVGAAACGLALADTIYTGDGNELKGIVVEEYKDRVVLSTEKGEIAVLKSAIREMRFDNPEDNLVRLAEGAWSRRDYNRAYAYYKMALGLNPNFKAARDGMIFLDGYLFRKEEGGKEDSVERQQVIERTGGFVAKDKGDREGLAEKAAKTKRTLGITLRSKDGVIIIEKVAPRSSAAEAGIKPGDALVAIWGKLTGYMQEEEIMDLLLDKPALEIKCSIERTVDVMINPRRNFLSSIKSLMGASFGMEFDGLTVTEVDRKGAAAGAGLKKGDLVTAIDGRPTRYMPINDAVGMIKDSKRDTARFTLRREIIMWRSD
ncbi:MAG: PDZ domain-containing protein [Candidatus Omnitrophota bacterium]